MKRLILMLTLCFSLISIVSQANEPEVSKVVLNSFASSFKDATNVKWVIVDQIYRVNFNMNGQYVSAFYNKDGQRIALTRNVTTQQLPLALQTSLKMNYENYWVSDLFELHGEEGTHYYLTLENSNSKLILKSGIDSDWTVFNKISK